MLSPGLEKGDIYISVPTVRLNHGGVSYSFTTPLPNIFGLWSSDNDDLEDEEEEASGGTLGQDTKKPAITNYSGPEITFNAGIRGTIRSTERLFNYMSGGVQKSSRVRTPTGYSRCLLTHNYLCSGLRQVCHDTGKLHLER